MKPRISELCADWSTVSMAQYKEDFPVGCAVRIADRSKLLDFQQTWKFHHKLTSEQISYAGRDTKVKGVSFYHGGDPLYELVDVPGIWHELCLGSIDSQD